MEKGITGGTGGRSECPQNTPYEIFKELKNVVIKVKI